jgi:hypothetical protein
MPKLYMVTVPGLDVKSDWPTVHDRLLDDFPDVTDVLATTIPATLLIVYRGPENIEAWWHRMSDAITSRRGNVRRSCSARTSAPATGADQK